VRQVVLYTKPGCSLCDYARAAILAVRREIDFEFQEIDIALDADLFDLYKFDIPVVEIDGRRAFKHRVDPEALKEKLT
jgi:glutaredoxin